MKKVTKQNEPLVAESQTLQWDGQTLVMSQCGVFLLAFNSLILVFGMI